MWRISVLTMICMAIIAVESCNEAVCASVVSKCMLTQSCKCDLKNCSCCRECFSCLSHLYSECCSCVDMCPKPNDTGSALSKKSHVEEFNDSYPSLFAALTTEPDPNNRWITYTYVNVIDRMPYVPDVHKSLELHTQSVDQHVNVTSDLDSKNCTVVFINECTTWKKCSDTCQSMGSASYRWFHDGCCECIGPLCINYGISESRCKNCSSDNHVEEGEGYDTDGDYGGDYND
ncbi:hypothetical protein R5R35_004972 [Gryllus longicercus]|uniref:Protein twisted gastrulation n=1 Tax=Gryllus longicercus TaxID=2509291 RepID=A0AAN9Z5B0_9ORTH